MDTARSTNHVRAGHTTHLTQSTNWGFRSFPLIERQMSALEGGESSYAIYRRFAFAARQDIAHLFDNLALNLGWNAHRLDASALVLESRSSLLIACGSNKRDYCSCMIDLWTDSVERADEARTAIFALVGAARIEAPTTFSVDWQFMTRDGLQSVRLEEIADDVLHDQAYPNIRGRIADFIDRYLRATEAILVLQGPPGTGKTRLIRAILGELSKRKGTQAQAVYTGDRKVLEGDELFATFLTSNADALVIEDADHLLKPRVDGNDDLHRFLMIADGVVRAQGRKIIFSTNLPNIGDLDDALIRPGRCFAHLNLRNLNHEEAQSLLAVLRKTAAVPSDSSEICAQRHYSLADIYRGGSPLLP